MKMLSTIMLALALTASPARADDEAPSGDLAKLQGKWTSMGGPARDTPVLLELKGTTVTMSAKFADGQTRTMVQGTIKVDEKAKPRAIDFLKCKGPLDGPLPDTQAIYDLDGDTLKIAYPKKGPEDRPTEFPKDEKDRACVVWKRAKDEAPK
ncbi:MAG TPA: TIGR03067 domain-containing protein [Isosphaeraceae bacterium]|jgi:uncharacterized protein (TIGR03067 family)|nr:TIGR03067 domain-containing protein [Isosphaeraceae bacterium]